MKLIVGLGNPGAKYQTTKHNVGFMTVDEIAVQEQVRFNQEEFSAVTTSFFCGSEKVILVKPQTFMNDSGRAVRPLMDYYRIDLSDLVVIYDDMDLEIGRLRLRAKGSAGGHNGIKSLIQHLGTSEFARIRIGIGRPLAGQTVIAHVLSSFAKKDHEAMHQAVKKAADAALFWAAGHSFVDTMNQFN